MAQKAEMMLIIGNSIVSRITYRVSRIAYCVLRREIPNTQYPIPNTKWGFTLVEVMVATAVLAIGSLYIHQAFFTSLDTFNYCSNYLGTASWMDEKIWQSQDAVRLFGNTAGIQSSGEFNYNNKQFKWTLTRKLLKFIERTGTDTKIMLFEINLALYWKEGQRNIKSTRAAYARYVKE